MEVKNSSGWLGELEICIEFEDNGIKYKTIFDRSSRTATVEKQEKSVTTRNSQKCPFDNFGRQVFEKKEEDLPKDIA